MKVILGIDTSSDICAGIAVDGRMVAARSLPERRAHAELLMPLIGDLCQECGIELRELTGIAVGVGPGPFTGLRVGVVTAATLGAVLQVPVTGVCSLDVVAAQWGADAPTDFVIVADARRQELYWARYRAGRRVDGPAVSPPRDIPAMPTAGPGVGVYELAGDCSGGPRVLDAGFLAAHVEQFPDAGMEPLYLRRPDADIPTTRKSALVQPRTGLRSGR